MAYVSDIVNLLLFLNVYNLMSKDKLLLWSISPQKDRFALQACTENINIIWWLLLITFSKQENIIIINTQTEVE